MFKFQKKREITPLERNAIVLEYLNEKIEMYKEICPDHKAITPIELLEIIRDYEQRKRSYM